MALLGRKKSSPAAQPPIDAPLSISEADLAQASQLMDRWDAAMGDSDAMWDCMEAIARRGGWAGMEATMQEAVAHGGGAAVTQRPWRWWDAAARTARETGNDVLAGRVFLFAYMFVTQLVPKMDWRNMASVGLDPPVDETYRTSPLQPPAPWRGSIPAS